MTRPGCSRAYWTLTLLWLLVVVPLGYLANGMVETTINSFQLRGSDPLCYPQITLWIRSLGATGLYAFVAMPAVVALLLAPWRSRLIVALLLGFSVVAAIYIVFAGLLAAYLAYVKLCL